MALTLILALQTATVPVPATLPAPPSASPPLAAISFDLSRYRAAIPAGCGGPGGSDILVCGRRGGGAYPLDQWARIFPPPAPIRAEMNLGGNVMGRVHATAVELDRGAVSNRFMLGIRWPF